MRNIEDLYRHRVTYIKYALERIEDEDWHGLSDAANDLRELDVEIRMIDEINKLTPDEGWERLHIVPAK